MTFTTDDVNMARVEREIALLSELGKLPSGGITRYTYSTEHQMAAKQVAEWMHVAGLDVYFDRWGNLFGRSPGFDDDQPCVMSGSHVDSVPNGGNYDGPLGVLAALEAVRMIHERGDDLHMPLEVVSFIEEEGARFSGLLGSRLATGKVSEAERPAMIGRDGVLFDDALNAVKWPYPVKPEIDLTERVSHYLELHIEQGRRLEDAQVPVGVVTGIAGPNFMNITLTGRSDHAGATAYEDRQDTLLAAAELIIGVRRMGRERFSGEGHMTVGYIQARPNVGNVVAGETDLTVDFRAASEQVARDMRSSVEILLDEISRQHRVNYEIAGMQSVPPTQTPPHIREAIENGADAAGVGRTPIISWAAHDAMVMADVCEAGMVFVPCRDGRSHTPEEYTAPEDIAAGIATLANALRALAT